MCRALISLSWSGGAGDNRTDVPFLDQNIAQSTITRGDLDRNWIGLGAAVEWIELRGMPMPVERHHELEDEAALVTVLADLPSDLAESLVRGVREEEPGPLVPIPSGIPDGTKPPARR